MATKIQFYIFDLDGTLTNTPFIDKAPRAVLLGRAEKLASLQAEGAKLAIATNQGGVAFGFTTEEAATEEVAAIARELKIDGFRVAFGHPKPKWGYDQYGTPEHLSKRKPAPGMLTSLMHEYKMRPAETMMIGDRDEDRDAAHAAECNFMWAKDFFGNRAELLESVYHLFLARSNALPNAASYWLQFFPDGSGSLRWESDDELAEWRRLEEAPDLLQMAFDVEDKEKEAAKGPVEMVTVAANDDFDPFLDSDDLP